MPKISIIVPIYKTEAYIKQCLESVLSQTFKDFEVLCVDDCSPDKSHEIVDAFAARDNRVKLIRHEQNLGLGGARNTAILRARGDFLASVDGDDRMRSNMLEKLYHASENETADIVVCGFNRVDGSGKIISQQKPYPGVLYNIDHELNVFRVTNPAFWNKLWKKSLYTDNNILFPNHVYYQDSATTPRVLTKAHKIKIIDDCLYDYLVRADSATFTYSPKHIIDYFTVFNVLKDYLLKESLFNRYRYQFESIISHMLKYHAGNVDQSSMAEEDKKVYLRNIAFLKSSFLEEDDELRKKSVNYLKQFLGKPPDRERAIESALKGGVTRPDQQIKGGSAMGCLADDISGNAAAQYATNSSVIVPETLEGLSILVKTFQRPEMIFRFLEAAGEYQRQHGIKFKEIIVGDDSSDENILKNKASIDNILMRHDMTIIHDVYNFNIGLSDARNRMVERASCEYILLCDDDFILDPKCDLGQALDFAKIKQVDILGGWLKNNYDVETGDYSYWASVGKMVDLPNELVLFLNETECSECEESDFLLNFYIARREVLIDIKWDAELKIEEHYDFFYRFFKSDYRAAITDKLFIRHTNEKPRNPKDYNEFRFKKETWEPALFKSIEKLGKERRTVNRWRKDHFVRWQTDLPSRSDIQTTVPLLEPIVNQRVSIDRLTPRYRNYFFGYFDVQAVSDDGRFHLYQTAPVMERVTKPGDVAEIGILDMETGCAEILATTTAWCHQQGAQLQFRKRSSTEIIFNYFDSDENRFGSKTVNIKTKEEKTHPLPIAALSPDGETAVSINFPRMYDYRPGYGYANLADAFGREVAPENDGLFSFSLRTGEVRQILSYKTMHELFIKDHFPNHQRSKVLINHVGFNTDGSKLVILFRTFSKTAPFPTFTLTCNADGSDLKCSFAFTSHYHWKDERILLISGANFYNKQKVKSIDLYELDTETGDAVLVDPDFFTGDGHCTYSPDRKLVLYDSYSETSFPYRKLQVYDLENRQGIDIGYFYSPPALHADNTDARCDLHPRWSPDGSQITFDSMHEGYRGIYTAKTADILAELARGFHALSETDLRKWYTAAHGKQIPKKAFAAHQKITTAQPVEVTNAVKALKLFVIPLKRFLGRCIEIPVIGPVLRVGRPVYYKVATPIYRVLNRK